MTADEHPHQTDEQGHDSSPWWWGVGPIGAVGLIVLGIAAALWSVFGLSGDSEDQAMVYYRAGRVVAIGLVIGGAALLGQLRRRATRTDVAEEHEGH